jgi:hypothetical protein
MQCKVDLLNLPKSHSQFAGSESQYSKDVRTEIEGTKWWCHRAARNTMEILIAQANDCSKRGWAEYAFACLFASIAGEPIKSTIRLLNPRSHVHKESKTGVNV